MSRKTAAAWERRPSPKEKKFGNGWVAEMDRAYTDGKYAVMIRTIDTDWGKVEHACVRNGASTDIPWRDKQRIKNELFGPDRVAVEVFPKESELVNDANMYHIWVLPAGGSLPFTLKGGNP